MLVNIDHFDNILIADSGQCFRWKKISPDTVRVVSFGKVLNIRKVSLGYELDCSKEEWESVWAEYFDMSTDYGEIEKKIGAFGDRHLCESFEEGKGIRILRQDLWEIIISFLISQNNNIGRIRNSVEALCRAGNIEIPGSGEYAFPGPGSIDTKLFSEVNLGLGYRVPYLKEMYEYVSLNPDWLSYLKTLDYEGARAELLKRKGIGPKVADCICLFGLHHIEAFPIDTHVKQLLAKYYPYGFDFKYFEGVAGIIQQYLFYFEIKKDKR